MLWQAQYAWLFNINARADNAYQPSRYATGPRSAATGPTNKTVLVKEVNSLVGTVLALV